MEARLRNNYIPLKAGAFYPHQIHYKRRKMKAKVLHKLPSVH